MEELAFWKPAILPEANSLETMVGSLARNHVHYCVIGGQGHIEPC